MRYFCDCDGLGQLLFLITIRKITTSNIQFNRSEQLHLGYPLLWCFCIRKYDMFLSNSIWCLGHRNRITSLQLVKKLERMRDFCCLTFTIYKMFVKITILCGFAVVAKTHMLRSAYIYAEPWSLINRCVSKYLHWIFNGIHMNNLRTKKNIYFEIRKGFNKCHQLFTAVKALPQSHCAIGIYPFRPELTN